MSYDTKPTSTYPITIPYFSNPSVDFLSTPTGNTNSEDNAQVLAFTAPYVSNFRNSVVQSILPTAFSYRVAEGNSTSFSVRLTVQPTSPVTVNLSMSGDSDLFVSSSPTLDFNSSNWNLPHPVQISCQSDSDTSDGSATLSLTATGITTRSIQISEIDQGSASVSNLLVTGSVVNALGIGESNIFLTFSNGGGTVKTDENGTFRNLLTSGWSGNITPALTDYSFTPSSLSVNSLSNNSLGNSFVSHRSNILYVDKDAMGRGDGSSWQNAYTELSVALVSKHSFTQVWVAEGVYLPGATRAASFTLPLNKSVYGGFASGESSFSERNISANPTVLSGDIGVSNNGTDNSFHVVVPSQNSVLDGFTIRDGNATYNFSNDDRGIGGGLYAKNSSFVISNCIFTSNQSYQRGGAVFIEDVNTTFRNCTFSNHVSTKGGAIDINNSQISFISCDFINNSSELQGGAIYWRESNGSIMDSNFTSNVNVTSNGGGGIYIENSSPSVTNCNFSFNVTHANNYGGAVKLAGSSPSFTNCSFVRNESKINSGGAIYIDSSSVPTFSGNEFQFNSAASFGGAIFTEGSNLDMNNSLFLGNYADLGGGVATQGSVAISFTNTMALVNEANSSVSSSAGFIYLNTGVTSSLFVNCVFSGNRSFGRNGVYRPHGMSRFVNCTFSGNQAVAEGGITIMFSGDSIDVSNCILWVNSGGTVNDIYVNGGTATANNSLFNPNQSNGTISGSNNINSDPLFTDFNGPDNILGNLDDDLTLQSTSPAIDIGSNSLTNYVNTDLNGRNRGGVPDLGAYEYSDNSAPSFTSISSLSIPENQMAVVVVNASDSDGNSLNYSITGGSDQSKFQIDSQTGVLTFLNAPDYENPTDSDGDGEYRVIVSVSDSVDTVTQEIVVSVSDSVDALETFTVSGGQSSSPYFTLIDSSGGVVDFSTYALQRGATYFFVASNISSSHPFMIGESNGDLSSSLVSDGPLTSSSNGQKITLTIPSDFSGPLYYFCTVHSGMNFSFQISKQAPVIAESSGSISLSLSEDGALSYDINASDPDGNSLLWSITSSASNGASNINSNTGVLSYTPTANYHGSDSVTVQVSDGSHTDSLIVALTVSPVNDAPMIVELIGGVPLSLSEDGTLDYDLNASDPEGDILLWSITSTALNGTVSILSDSGVLSYTPIQNYNGYDSLTVQVSDGYLSDSLSINFIVSSVNDFPVITETNSSISHLLLENTSWNYDFNVTDPDLDLHVWSIISAPVNGTAAIVSDTGILTYTPKTEYNGSDSFSLQVSDGSANDTLSVNITVYSTADIPVISDLNESLNLSLVEDGSLAYDLNATEGNGETLTWIITNRAKNGTASIDPSTGAFSYNPNTNYFGADSVTIQVSNGLLTDSLTINLTISSVNDAPIISEQGQSISLSLSQNTSLNYDINATEMDGDSLAWTLTKQATNGIAWISSDTGVFSYNPKADFNGSDSVSLQVSDGLAVDTLTVNITIHSVESVIFLTDGIEQPSLPGWKRAGWFGYFFSDFYPWVFHENLGWIYVSQNDLQGAWFHHKQLGWIWTKPQEFPALYRDSDYTDDVKGSWIYLDRTVGPTRYYDYAQEQWLVID